MKIAIHKRKGGFYQRWINYCETNNISYKAVNCYSNDIVDQLKECDALLWHHNQMNPTDLIIAKQILYALEHSGFKVFPNFNTGWHFDDKLGQKYLLEAIGAPIVPSYAFFSKKDALEWVFKQDFPKVFKLRGGAGSANVDLVRTKKEAIKYINKAFGRGFRQYEPWSNLRERWRKYRLGLTDLYDVFKGVLRFYEEPEFSKTIGYERGYVYFQDFIPDNDSDIRVIVIGKRAFAVRRFIREGDFRASGSGIKEYDREKIDLKLVEISFKFAKKLNSDSLAFDFIYDKGSPLIVELSYGFAVEFYDPCPGYWDNQLNWHEGFFNPQEWMVEDLVNKIKSRAIE